MSPDARPKTTRFGHYEILSLLGKGGMAEVYRARVVEGPRQGWPVAIKRLLPELASHPDYVQRFGVEAELAQGLNHPNIVRVLEVGAIAGVRYMAMELVDGSDLGKVIRRCKQRGIPLPIDFAVYLAKVLLDSLAFAHAAVGGGGEPLGLVHCDVSPSNLFISRTGEIKLGDFGIARARTTGGPSSLMGKPYYLSPEVLAGEVTPAADVWAAAVSLYELLTLQRPFQGSTPEEVFEAIRGRMVIPVRDLRPEVSPALEAILERAFSVEVEERFTTATAFADALTAHYDDQVGTPLAIAAVVRGLFGAAAPGERGGG